MVCNKPKSLWVKVMRYKYRCVDSILPKVSKKLKASSAWRGIMQVWLKFEQNLVWRLGNGQNVKMWTDHWHPGIHALGDFAFLPKCG